MAGDEVDTELITQDIHPEALGLKTVQDADSGLPRACGPCCFFLKEAMSDLAGPTPVDCQAWLREMANLACSDSDCREAWLFQRRAWAVNNQANQALQTWELGSETAE